MKKVKITNKDVTDLTQVLDHEIIRILDYKVPSLKCVKNVKWTIEYEYE